MIFEIEISEQADVDLRGIFEYIAFELQSPENESWHSRGLRLMPVDNYCVPYIPNKEDAVVTIIRVMYGGRDIDAQLKKYTGQ